MNGGPDIPLPAKSVLAGLLSDAGLSVPPGAVDAFIAHAGEMLRWNRSIRLTTITDPDEVAVKHILDSLLLLRFSPFPGRILDFGSGAGYPGIPLAVALPETRVVLLESSAKKCAFLSHLRRTLSLANTEVVQGRLEPRRPLDLGTFEHIVTRATLPPEDAVFLLLPYLAPGGRILVMTGGGGGSKRGKRLRGPRLLPPGASLGRTCRFELPLRMGLREIREILAP